jgi:prolyl-tRNA synthetase
MWPITVAPYEVHLVSLAGKRDADGEVSSRADQLYRDLQNMGIGVLYDDRDESPGVKFNDADLLGMPIRLTVSSRSLKQGGVEFKRRDQQERDIIPLPEVCLRVDEEIAVLQGDIRKMIVEVPFEE